MGYWKYIGITTSSAEGTVDIVSTNEHLLDGSSRTTWSGMGWTKHGYLNNVANILPLENKSYEIVDSVVSSRFHWDASILAGSSPTSQIMHGIGRWTKKLIFSYIVNYYSPVVHTTIPCLVIIAANNTNSATWDVVICSYCGGIAWASETDRSIYEISDNYYLVIRRFSPNNYPTNTMQFICPINTRNKNTPIIMPASIPVEGWACEDNPEVWSWKNYHSSMTWDDRVTKWEAPWAPTISSPMYWLSGIDKFNLGPATNYPFTYGTFSQHEFDGRTYLYGERGVINEIQPSGGGPM